MDISRVLSADAFTKIGENVEIAGWVHRVRNLGGVQFIVLRDRSGQIQLVSERRIHPAGGVGDHGPGEG